MRELNGLQAEHRPAHLLATVVPTLMFGILAPGLALPPYPAPLRGDEQSAAPSARAARLAGAAQASRLHAAAAVPESAVAGPSAGERVHRAGGCGPAAVKTSGPNILRSGCAA